MNNDLISTETLWGDCESNPPFLVGRTSLNSGWIYSVGEIYFILTSGLSAWCSSNYLIVLFLGICLLWFASCSVQTAFGDAASPSWCVDLLLFCEEVNLSQPAVIFNLAMIRWDLSDWISWCCSDRISDLRGWQTAALPAVVTSYYLQQNHAAPG